MCNTVAGGPSCLPGWRCDTTKNRCVKDTEPAESKVEKIPEPVPKEEKVVKPEPVVEEAVKPEIKDGGPKEQPPKEVIPEQPTLQCPYQKLSTTVNCSDRQGCKYFSEKFENSKVELPVSLAGAAAVAQGGELSVIQNPGAKMFVYVLGGGNNAPGADTYYSEAELFNLDKNIRLVEWKKGPSLKAARYAPYAFIYRGFVYVVGGEDAGGRVVSRVERAPMQADGSLGVFVSAGNWTNPRPKAGVVFLHGYLYFIGGLGADGKPSKTVERGLIQPDGSLGVVEPVTSELGGKTVSADLPEGRVGPIVFNDHFLYVLGKGATNNVLMSRVLPDGMLEGWCQTTPTPDDKDHKLKTYQAVSDQRRLLLYGVVGSDDKPVGQIYFGAAKKGTPERPLGGGLETWRCSSPTSSPTKAELLTPRLDAAAVLIDKFLIVIGGVDGNKTALKSIEVGKLNYREGQCDHDFDGAADNRDHCPVNYSPLNKNSDQPASITFPGDTGNGWIDRFGRGDACEDKAMSLIPAGKFRRGFVTSDNQPDAPPNDVVLDTFFIDPKEVSNADYAECVKQGKCTKPGSEKVGKITDYYSNQTYKDHPVVHVTWKMAQDYCKFRGKRLPTEAEWEKAARGIDASSYPWGNVAPVCTKDQQQANFVDCKAESPAAGGSLVKGVSPYGLFDMGGNVREWVGDFYDAGYYREKSSLINPKGPEGKTERVIRGGSYKTDAKSVRTYTREKADPTTAQEDLGFRCSRDLFVSLKAP